MNTTLVPFLNRLSSQQEISLLIAQNDDQEKLFQQELDNNNYSHPASTEELLSNMTKPMKQYVVIYPENQKDAYDISVQYPTGQVEIFDPKTMKSKTATPTYKDSSVVFMITKERLATMRNSGLDVLQHVGLTYQE